MQKNNESNKLDTAPTQKKDSEGQVLTSTPTLNPEGSRGDNDVEAVSVNTSSSSPTNRSDDESNSDAPDTLAVKRKSSIHKSSAVILPYVDRANFIIDDLTHSDHRMLGLYEGSKMVGGPFPVKLQIILKLSEELGFQNIISWLPHGRSFMIHRPREFGEKIMGEFFKQTKLTSFKRQLNLYDFKRVSRGTDCGSYYHDMFLRGKPLLAKRMIRSKIKGGLNKKNARDTEEDEHIPDFYSMPFVGTNRSGLDYQQARRLMNHMVSSSAATTRTDISSTSNIMSSGLVEGTGGAGLVGAPSPHELSARDYVNGSFQNTNILYGAGGSVLAGAPTLSHQLAGWQLGAGGPLPPRSVWDIAHNNVDSRLLSQYNRFTGGDGFMGLSLPSSSALQPNNLNNNNLSSLRSLQQPQHNNDMQSAYAASIENLHNNPYAITANALTRDMEMATSNARLLSPEEQAFLSLQQGGGF